MSLFALRWRGTAAAIALVAGLAASNQASAASTPSVEPLYSGGSTLAEIVYRNIFNCYGDNSASVAPSMQTTIHNPSCAASPYNPNVEPIYVGVGSGNGQSAFTTDNAANYSAGSRVPDNPPVASPGDAAAGPFYGSNSGGVWTPGTTPAFPSVQFSGSDAVLTQAKITTAYGLKFGTPIQLPTLVFGIGIPFEPSSTGKWNPHGTTVKNSTSKVNLSTNTICGIFTGNIKDWSDSHITADNDGVPLDVAPSPITVVYRADGSGTTFQFANALLAQCAKTSYPLPAAWQGTAIGQDPVSPDGDEGTSTNFFNNIASHVTGGLPANFVSAPGSQGVAEKILATPGSIGYVSPDFVQPVNTAGPATANVQTAASIGGKTSWIALTTADAAKIMSKVKPPSFAASSCTVDSSPPTWAWGTSPDGICAHNPFNWGVLNPDPAGAGVYPIGGFTYVELYECYKTATAVNALAGTTTGSLGLFRWYYGSTTENNDAVATVLPANGFSVLPGAWISGAKKLLTTDKVTKIRVGPVTNVCTAAAAST